VVIVPVGAAAPVTGWGSDTPRVDCAMQAVGRHRVRNQTGRYRPARPVPVAFARSVAVTRDGRVSACKW
jgi:hypothetical protein